MRWWRKARRQQTSRWTLPVKSQPRRKALRPRQRPRRRQLLLKTYLLLLLLLLLAEEERAIRGRSRHAPLELFAARRNWPPPSWRWKQQLQQQQ